MLIQTFNSRHTPSPSHLLRERMLRGRMEGLTNNFLLEEEKRQTERNERTDTTITTFLESFLFFLLLPF